MNDSNPLLGFTADQHAPPCDEIDQRERSAKKIKNHEHNNEATTSSKSFEDDRELVHQKNKERRPLSYKETMLGSQDNINGEKEGSRGTTGMDMNEDEEDDSAGVEGTIEEQKVGEVDCPIFKFSEKEEQRIQRPWKQGVIVQLLGRKIGYKALETRLKQMWVRRGIIQIVDLSHDFYLVTFTSWEDQCRAMMEGPWLIYDHYLVVRPWSPNFNPATAVTTSTAVWVRFSGLPIEYYDARILHFIGNRIGKTVKVDKNTLLQERGKYARLCVEVDLSKPLLAMFTLKERQYKVEYEGLHLLCLNCGRFGHYVEGCPEIVKTAGEKGGGEKGVVNNEGASMTRAEGPWTIVQKPRRQRKSKDATTTAGENNAQKGTERGTTTVENSGSRFSILGDNSDQQEEDMRENSRKVNDNTDKEVHTSNMKSKQSKSQISHQVEREKNNMSETQVHKESTKGGARVNKNQNITASRVTFKDKKATPMSKKVENYAELIDHSQITNFFNNPILKQGETLQANMGKRQMLLPNIHLLGSDNQENVHFEYHRDPGINGGDKISVTSIESPLLSPTQHDTSLIQSKGGHKVRDMEVFEHVKDNGEPNVEESDMEIVLETPNVDKQA
ncbi:hypothetical protein A2U01_0000242 [Trifolium medium]|uniref:CCHC-type domain-containing protein n=1 Tax=Trifolium medium TaxID=97028 RepID=A0A392LX10_9FABA|nr:hypothetical protein [Trifolium medium]